ncbi:hypothetical protein Hanom_Chr08g00754711 [Helianthus anomalus]
MVAVKGLSMFKTRVSGDRETSKSGDFTRSRVLLSFDFESMTPSCDGVVCRWIPSRRIWFSLRWLKMDSQALTISQSELIDHADLDFLLVISTICDLMLQFLFCWFIIVFEYH